MLGLDYNFAFLFTAAHRKIIHAVAFLAGLVKCWILTLLVSSATTSTVAT